MSGKTAQAWWQALVSRMQQSHVEAGSRTMGKRIFMTLGAVLSLAACQMGKTPAASPTVPQKVEAGAVVASAGTQRDVEAPEIFHVTDKALWDGRPSLGNIWVAHKSVTEPERVIIRNKANGMVVQGALFRREFDNPGPPIQLSSDAADALGILAGQPATVEIVALKRVDVAPPPAAKPAATAAAATAATASTAKPQAKPAAPKGAASVTQAAQPPAKPAKPAKADPVATQAAAAIEAATAANGKAAAKPQTAATAAPAAKGATAAPADKGAAPTKPLNAMTPRKPFVQVGVFSTEDNAKGAAKAMQKAGLAPQIKQDKAQGKPVWRVLVGPAATITDLEQMAALVKKLGYPDSYPVRK